MLFPLIHIIVAILRRSLRRSALPKVPFVLFHLPLHELFASLDLVVLPVPLLQLAVESLYSVLVLVALCLVHVELSSEGFELASLRFN